MARFSRIGVFVLGIVVLLAVSAQFAQVPPADAATIEKLHVTCSQIIIAGKTEVAAPFVKVQVAQASNLTSIIAQQVVSTRTRLGANYRGVLDISAAHLPNGTLLVIAVGEWNGVHYLKPARIVTRYCFGGGGTPQPTPVSSPTLPPGTPQFTPFPTFTLPPGTLPPTPTQPPGGTPLPTPFPPPLGSPSPTPLPH